MSFAGTLRNVSMSKVVVPVAVVAVSPAAKEANRTVCDKATGTAIAAAIALFRNDFFIVRLPLSSFDFFCTFFSAVPEIIIKNAF